MTSSRPQGDLTVERMCELGCVGRPGYYRHWKKSAPRQEETAVRDPDPAGGAGEPLLRPPAHLQGAVQSRHRGEPQARFTADAAGQSAVPAQAAVRAGDDRLAPCLARGANLARGMVPTGVDQLWVADITYVRLAEEFAFLAVVLDAFSRRVIGWALDTHLRADLATAALKMAIEQRRPQRDTLIHHSDRGVQYACAEYTRLLEAHGIQPSMSRIGNPYDNAKAESFMKTLKHEEVDGRDYRNLDEAREAIGIFIEKVYNRQRLHSALGYRPPAVFEENLQHQAAAARRPLAVATATSS
jgi:Transposase and inactivated derivatives